MWGQEEYINSCQEEPRKEREKEMANYNDYENLTLHMIKSLADDSWFLTTHFFHNEFTRNQFNSIREEHIGNGYVKMRTLSFETLVKYGVIVKSRTEIYHVYVKHYNWGNSMVLSDITDELWATLPQSIRSELDIDREERKRYYYTINYDKVNELMSIRDWLDTIFD